MSRGNPQGGTDDGFLARWSRRKQEARRGLEEPEVPPEEPAAKPETDADAVDEDTLSDAELLARYELPDPETLTASDDVAAFMRKGVPSRLQRLALRRLWRLDPVLANLDGLNDYDDDYTNATAVLEGVKTVYQVGKGAAAYLQEAADKLTGATAPEGPPAESGEEPERVTHENVKEIPAEAEATAVPEEREQRPPAAAEEPVPRRRRHMAFSGPDGRSLQTFPRHSND